MHDSTANTVSEQRKLPDATARERMRPCARERAHGWTVYCTVATFPNDCGCIRASQRSGRAGVRGTAGALHVFIRGRCHSTGMPHGAIPQGQTGPAVDSAPCTRARAGLGLSARSAVPAFWPVADWLPPACPLCWLLHWSGTSSRHACHSPASGGAHYATPAAKHAAGNEQGQVC